MTSAGVGVPRTQFKRGQNEMQTMVGVVVVALSAAWALAYFRAPLILWTAIIAALLAAATFVCPVSGVTWVVIWTLFVAIALTFNFAPLRRALLSNRLFATFKRIMPSMSTTEREALDAGTVWW